MGYELWLGAIVGGLLGADLGLRLARAAVPSVDEVFASAERRWARMSREADMVAELGAARVNAGRVSR